MADEVVSFRDGTKIGLVVRGKYSPQHHPDKMAQHADAILADGSPVGFYGVGNDNSGNALGMRMQGIVYDYATMRLNRPWYVDMDQAISNRVISTVLLVTVTSDQAKAFADAWSSMTRAPGSFNILGGNCSTHSSAAFLDAKVVQGGIPGIDTPDRLYDQLVEALPKGSLRTISGFIGFVPAGGGGYNMVIRPYDDSERVNRPNPGSSGSLSTNSSLEWT